MAFAREVNVTITGIGDVSIKLFVPDVIDLEHPQTGEIDIQLKMSNGTIKIKTADLLARLNDDATGQAHLANLVAMKNYLKTRILSEVLPI